MALIPLTLQKWHHGPYFWRKLKAREIGGSQSHGTREQQSWGVTSGLLLSKVVSHHISVDEEGKKGQRNRSFPRVAFDTLIHVELLTGTRHLGCFWSVDGPGDKSVNSLGGDWRGEQRLSWHTSQHWAFSDFACISHMHERLTGRLLCL